MDNSTDFSRLFLILSNNAMMAFIILSMSITRYKFVPAGAIFYNSLVLSCLMLAANARLGTTAIIYGFLPHAIIEIPGIMIGGVFSFLAIDAFREMNIQYSHHVIPKLTRESINEVIFKPYFTTILPIIAASAFVEVFVSYNLLRSIL